MRVCGTKDCRAIPNDGDEYCVACMREMIRRRGVNTMESMAIKNKEYESRIKEAARLIALAINFVSDARAMEMAAWLERNGFSGMSLLDKSADELLRDAAEKLGW